VELSGLVLPTNKEYWIIYITINISDIFLVLKAYLGQLYIIKVSGYDGIQ
jgi:hypothetical protein